MRKSPRLERRPCARRRRCRSGGPWPASARSSGDELLDHLEQALEGGPAAELVEERCARTRVTMQRLADRPAALRHDGVGRDVGVEQDADGAVVDEVAVEHEPVAARARVPPTPCRR